MSGWKVLIALVGFGVCSVGVAVELEQKLPQFDPSKHQLEIGDYSRTTGAPADVAAIEMSRQILAQEGIDDLREEFKGRLAALYWEDYPNQAIHVRLTGAAAVAPRKIQTSAGPVPVVFELGAVMTLDEQNKKLRASWPSLKKMLPGLIGAGVNERFGYVAIDIRSESGDARPYADEKASVERLLGMPVKFTFVPEEPRPAPPAVLRSGAKSSVGPAAVIPGVLPGGWMLNAGSQYCTGGFTVRDPVSGKRGVLTAGHCPNSAVYMNYAVPPNPLPTVALPTTMEAEHWGGTTDFQWHSFAEGVTVNDVYCTSFTSCGGVIILKVSAPSIGTRMCHMGATTGASCGTLTMNNFIYNDVAHPCENQDPLTCPTGTWLRVEGSSLACAGGDSGGPVYANSVAYGLAKAAISTGTAPGQCPALIVMPINRVADKGLILL
ncbi:S1 family peptidase [Stenotrophomonas maltophilia]|uniref:S1 family peptidase n=1 Tax=Stenotrophomonas maltophilia TaxID=40324 RepID=UPI000A744678|nr:S1 family peptidase [Stenotrophomonas maltophilia]